MTSPELRLVPPPTKGHLSVARLAQYWYVACLAGELKKTPIARVLLGTPIVLYRDGSGRAAALLDRCPHRNVPLSLGRVADTGRLECPYHGWQFEPNGRCSLVPGLCDEQISETRRAPSFAVRERAGLVWVWATPDQEPAGEPFDLPLVGAPGYTTVTRTVQAEATLHATIENALDVPHTAYLHRGLFRGNAAKNEITAVVRRSGDRVEAEYLGEPRPPGLAARVLSPSGGEVQHWDRFVLPSVAQVEYRLGSENHILVTALGTPVSDFVTRLHAVVSLKLRLPTALVKPLLMPLALRIFEQDSVILRQQSETIRRFGGEQYMSTEIDVLGQHVWRLLRAAERGEVKADAETVVERSIRFMA